MSEQSVIVLPTEAPSISTADLSDTELAALSDEEIQRLPDTERKKVACRLLVANELRLPDDPPSMTLGQIAKRVGLSERQFLRWRQEDTWLPMMKDEHARASSFIDDIPLTHPRPRLRALEKQFHDPNTRPPVRVKILQVFASVDEQRRNPDVERETKGVRERMRGKLEKLLGPLPTPPSDTPDQSSPTDSAPGVNSSLDKPNQ